LLAVTVNRAVLPEQIQVAAGWVEILKGTTTTAVIVAALADRQVVPLEARDARTDTDLVPIAAPLTVYVTLPVPENVPAGLVGLTDHV
jgi:hypothetical protein